MTRVRAQSLSVPFVSGLTTTTCSSSSSSGSGSSGSNSGSSNAANATAIAALINSLAKQNLTAAQVQEILAKNILKKAAMRLSMAGIDYNDVINNATKLALLKTSVCATAVFAATRSGTLNATCTCDQVLPGSVITVLTVQGYEQNSTSNSLQSGLDAFAADPLATMRAAAAADATQPSVLANFNVTSASATVTVDGESESSSKTGVIVGAAVGGGVGLLAAVGVAVWLMKKKGEGKVADANSAPSGSAASNAQAPLIPQAQGAVPKSEV